MAPPTPLISQYDDIDPNQFCNGDNRPADCGQNCMCTHKVDIPLNAIVEVVLVDEGKFSVDKYTYWLCLIVQETIWLTFLDCNMIYYIKDLKFGTWALYHI